MHVHRVGTSGLELSELGLGTFDWGSRVDDSTAQQLLDTYAQAGGTVLELPAFASPAADVLGRLTVSDEITVCARVGVAQRGDEPVLSLSRQQVLRQTRELLQRMNRQHIDVLVLDGFDARTPLEETASALDTLLGSGDIGYIACAYHAGWQLAAVAGVGIPVAAAFNEHSLLERSAETDVAPAADYLGIGMVAGAALGRGALSGQYLRGVPAQSRAAVHQDGYMQRYLSEDARRIVAGVCKAASSLEIAPVDVALAWTRSQAPACSLISPRTVDQLEQLLGSDADLQPEIVQVLDQISDPAVDDPTA